MANTNTTGVTLGKGNNIGNQIKFKDKPKYSPDTSRPASAQVRFKQDGDQVGNPLNNYSNFTFPKVSNPDGKASRTANVTGSQGPNALKRYK